MNPANLKYLKSGEHITTTHYAAVTRAARSFHGLQNSSGDADGIYTRDKPPKPKMIQVHSTVAIPKNRIFEVIDMYENKVSPIFKVDKYDDSRLSHMFATNEVSDIKAGGYGWATLISYEPVRVYCDPAGHVPNVLDTFGLADNTTDFAQDVAGLVCLAAPDTENFIYVTCDKSGSSTDILDCPCCNGRNCLPYCSGTVLCTTFANGHALRYTANLGTFSRYPALGGNWTFYHCSLSSEWSNAPPGTCVWDTHDITINAIPWAASSCYIQGDIVTSAGKLYSATTAGRPLTSGSTAPTHSSGAASDGLITWQYLAAGTSGVMRWRLTVSGGLSLVISAIPATFGTTGARDVINAGFGVNPNRAYIWMPERQLSASTTFGSLGIRCEEKFILWKRDAQQAGDNVAINVCVKPLN